MTLLEVAVALVLVAIGLSAIGQAAHTAARMSSRARSLTTALVHAGWIADSLAEARPLWPDSLRTGGASIAWTITQRREDGILHVLLHVSVPGIPESLLFPLLVGPTVPGID